MALSSLSSAAFALLVWCVAVSGQNITTNLPQVEYPAFNSTNRDGAANITTYLIEDDLANGTVQNGHLSILHNPLGQFVVLPPAAGCVSTSNGVTTGGRSLTSTTAATGNCHVATNGALFNVTTGACLGNLVSNGVVIQAPGTQNVNFGLRNGKFVTGYVSALEAQGRVPGKQPFDQLTSGVVWLVKDGQNYVQQNLPYEDPTTQTTGTIQVFASIVSARTAIGHNAVGEVLLLQLDGQSNVRGKTLYEVADLMISYGAINAINLDGGGSSAFATNGILSSYPSDMINGTINNKIFSVRTERAVTSIVCFKDQFRIAPTQICDPTSQNPNQCFNTAGTLSICCPGFCPPSPGPLPACGNAVPTTVTTSVTTPVTVPQPSSTPGVIVNNPTAAPPTPGTSRPATSAPVTSAPIASGAATSAPTTSAPTTSAPTTTVPATSAPTTSATASAPTTLPPVSSSPTTSAPATSAPTTSAPAAGPVSGATATASTAGAAGTAPPCVPGSNNPNQCFDATGSASVCCPGLCPQTPGATPRC